MRFGLVGYPLSHSFSQPYFTEKFAQLGISDSYLYVNFELEHISDFPKILEQYPDLGGLNVTIPHKEAVIPYLDELSPAARAIGAVNTIVIKDGKTIGYNTDVLGFRDDFLDFLDLNVAKPSFKSNVIGQASSEGNRAEPVLLSVKKTATLARREDFASMRSKSLLTDHQARLEARSVSELKSPSKQATAFTKASLKGKKALVLGTGGASLAVHYTLNELGIETTAVSRTPAKGQISYADLTAERLNEYTFVINTTPLGMSPKVEGRPDLPYAAFSAQHYCYDIVYNPEVTRFLRTAAAHGANVRNGLGMLHGQAEAAWDIWDSTPTKNSQS